MEEEPELSPAAAAKKAMAQLTAPIRSSSWSGSSPGSPACCSSKIAVTIIAAVLISAFNALTLSPALCAVFLRHPGPRRGLMGLISRGIDGVRDGYALLVGKLVRFSVLGVVLVVAYGLGVGGLSRVTPTS